MIVCSCVSDDGSESSDNSVANAFCSASRMQTSFVGGTRAGTVLEPCNYQQLSNTNEQ